MKVLSINKRSLRNVKDKELLSLNHRLHQLYGTLSHIDDLEKRQKQKNILESKFKLVVEEMKRRKMNVSVDTPLYKAVFGIKKENTKPVIDKLIKAKDNIIIIPGYVSLVGSNVKKLEGKEVDPEDVDVLIRDTTRHEGLEVQLLKLIPEDKIDSIHFVYDPQGAHDDSVPLFNLALVPVKKPEVQKIQKELKPLSKIIPLKTTGGYNKQAFFSLDDAWNFWAKGYIPDPGVVVEEKFDGFRCIAEIDSEGKTLVYFEDSKKDRSGEFDNLVSDLKLIGKPVILDGEFILINKKTGDKIARKDMMVLLGKNPNINDYNYVLEVFDILYYDDRDLTKLPWNERKQILEQLFENKDFKTLREVKSYIARSKEEFYKYSEKVRKIKDSEGAFYKVYNSPYPLNGRTPLWAKMKNIKEIHGVVLEVNEVK